jgi:AraC-like DNA-binding protein
MNDYISVKEAALAWGVSERRVHKLCEGGRIASVTKLGRAWMIPAQTLKPPDARREHSELRSAGNTEIRMVENLLGPDAKLALKNDGFAVFRLENATGNGVVTAYGVFPGVSLAYFDLHMQKANGFGAFATQGSEPVLSVNHCREGRFECETNSGERIHLGQGDLAVSNMPSPLRASSFPLSHYHGISIQLDVGNAEGTLGEVCELLHISKINLRMMETRLLENRPYFLLRSTDAVEHIFFELYNAPTALKESYIRLKLIELLLFLSAAEPESTGKRRYFYKTRVDAVKAVRDYVTANLEKQFTLLELSKLFDIPLTAMKTCFKTVFGMPIGEYLRKYRLQSAAVRLRETDEPIAEIAAQVGYDSHARFTAAFRAFSGATPSGYRKVFVPKG